MMDGKSDIVNIYASANELQVYPKGGVDGPIGGPPRGQCAKLIRKTAKLFSYPQIPKTQNQKK